MQSFVVSIFKVMEVEWFDIYVEEILQLDFMQIRLYQLDLLDVGYIWSNIF